MPSIIVEQLAIPPIKLTPFKKFFNKSTKQVRGKIQDYMIDSNEENIHDLRRNIRRFDASFRLLPKKLRKNVDAMDLKDNYKSLFRINSEIRDMDIIRSEFTQFPPNVASSYPNFLKGLEEVRNKKLAEARKVALSAYDLKPLKVEKAALSKKKILSRYEKVTTNYVTEIERLLPIVLSDGEKTADLHQLRKDCKKMRYILEAVNSDGTKEMKQAESMIDNLEEIQNDLGAIHDCDMVLLHLAKGRGALHSRRGNSNGDGKGDYSDLINLEQRKREKLYSQFVTRFGNGAVKQSLVFSEQK